MIYLDFCFINKEKKFLKAITCTEILMQVLN